MGFSGSPNDQSDSLFLLLGRFDGDLNQSVVELIDLSNFDVLNVYNPDFNMINELVLKNNKELFERIKFDEAEDRRGVKHPLLLNDGSIMFIGQDSPLIQIDKNSNPLNVIANIKYHHSIEPFGIDKFYVCSFSAVSEPLKKYYPKNLYDSIVRINIKGEIEYEQNLANIFFDNEIDHFISYQYPTDHFHLNDIEPVMKDGKHWKYGDLFLSIRNLNLVILYRPSTNKVIWKSEGHLHHQHDVDIISNNEISIFNNNTRYLTKKNILSVDESNEVIIYNFENDTYSQYLKNSLIKNNIRTNTQGLSQILPNGDLFLEETDRGRLFYFKEDGTKVWEYNNKYEDGYYRQLTWSRILYKHNDINIVKKHFFK